jgi:hypothetical protein
VPSHVAVFPYVDCDGVIGSPGDVVDWALVKAITNYKHAVTTQLVAFMGDARLRESSSPSALQSVSCLHQPPLIRATEHSNIHALRCVIPHSSRYALSEAMSYTCSADILEILLSAGADASARDNAAICNTAYVSCATSVRLLVAAGADPNARDGQPLISAVRWGRLPTVEALLEAGARADVRNSATVSAVMDYIGPNAPELARLLLSVREYAPSVSADVLCAARHASQSADAPSHAAELLSVFISFHRV